MSDEGRSTPVESKKDFGKPPSGTVSRWLAEIDLYEREFKKYHDRAAKIVKRYRDERDDSSTKKQMNILWSNVETLKPAMYAKAPVPDVQRRYKDQDPVGKAAAETLERCLSYHIDSYDFDNTLTKCRDDYLLVGRGQAWVRYDPLIAPGSSGGEAGQDYEEVVSEHVACDYVYWKDFGHTPARTWDEVDAVWRRVYMTRDALVKRFGAKGKDVQLDTKPESMSKEEASKHGETFKTACVYEIWDKRDRKAIWIARGYTDGALDSKEDPLRLERFFPCPRPLYGNLTTDSLVPLPDFAQYQDQANEIDELTDRIASLTVALKAVGWYAGDVKNEWKQAEKAKDGEIIPVFNWALLGEKGGLDKMIVWYPIEQVANTIVSLSQRRMELKQDLLEVTGLSDIVRGQGDARETATAQQIKGQFASMRLKDRQKEMARFARDILRIKAEIIAEQFAPETLALMSGQKFPMTEAERMAPMLQWQQQMQMMQMQQAAMNPGLAGNADQTPPGQSGQPPAPAAAPPEQPEIPDASWESILQILHDDRLRSYRIDIETDSTIALDEQLEKEQASELLAAVTPYLQGMTEALQTAPAMLELMGQMLMATTRRYKMGRGLEETFERTIEELKQIASQPRPDPNAAALELEKQKAQAQIQIKQADSQQSMQLEQQKAAANQQMEQMKLQADMQRKDAELAHQMRLEEMKLAWETHKMGAEHAMQREQSQLDNELKRDQAALDYDLKSSGAQQDMEIKHEQSEAKIAQGEAATQAKIEQGAVAAEAKAAQAGAAKGNAVGQGSGRVRSGAGNRSAAAPQAAARNTAGPLGTMATAMKEQTEAMTAIAKAMVQIAEANQAAAMMPRLIDIKRDSAGRLVGGMSVPVGNA